jgi:hypothetical protein
MSAQSQVVSVCLAPLGCIVSGDVCEVVDVDRQSFIRRHPIQDRLTYPLSGRVAVDGVQEVGHRGPYGNFAKRGFGIMLDGLGYGRGGYVMDGYAAWDRHLADLAHGDDVCATQGVVSFQQGYVRTVVGDGIGLFRQGDELAVGETEPGCREITSAFDDLFTFYREAACFP